MEDQSILLKIHRQFKKDEAIAALLKIISELRFEIGVQKSEIAELKSENKLLKATPILRTKKQWLQEEIMVKFKEDILKAELKAQEYRHELKKYHQMYLDLYIKTKAE